MSNSTAPVSESDLDSASALDASGRPTSAAREALAPPPDATRSKAFTSESLGGESLRMLIVEDHVMVRNCLRLLLERGNDGRVRAGQRPWRVVGEASTCAEALDLAAREQPHVVLLDLHLEDGDGLDLLPTLSLLCPCRAIVLSGWVDAAVAERARVAGVSDVLPKTVEPEILFAAIARAATSPNIV